MTAIYLASSWRNEAQSHVLAQLRDAGHAVYDFRNPEDSWRQPTSGDDSGGFRWSDIDPVLPEPELMYLMADGIHLTTESLLAELR